MAINVHDIDASELAGHLTANPPLGQGDSIEDIINDEMLYIVNLFLKHQGRKITAVILVVEKE